MGHLGVTTSISKKLLNLKVKKFQREIIILKDARTYYNQQVPFQLY